MNPSFAARYRHGVETSPTDEILRINGYDMDTLFKKIIPESPSSIPIQNMSDEKVAEILTARLHVISVNDPGQLFASLQAAGVSDPAQLRKAILSVYPLAKVVNLVSASKIVDQWN